MKLSVRVFGFPLKEYAPIARRADELGFEAVWIPEHLVAPLAFDANYPYSQTGKPTFEPETPFGDPWVMLGQLAAATSRIQLGVGVFVLPLRNPFAAAKSVATAQDLSDGRVLMGIGIGWMREEFETLGEKFDRRGARTEEMLDVMRKLWTGQPVAHDGEWYRFQTVQMSPGLSHPPPLIFGGAGELALHRAARIGDGWYSPPCDLAAAIGYRDVLRRDLAAAGRDAADFQFWVRAPAVSDKADLRRVIAQYRESGFEHLVVQVPRDTDSGNGTRMAWLEMLAGLQEG
jgi:probable F420-dependent oxidoreductase